MLVGHVSRKRTVSCGAAGETNFLPLGKVCAGPAAAGLQAGKMESGMGETRIGTVGIVVDDPEVTGRINAILHEYADIIVGRLGIPYRSRGVSIIALAVDGSMDAISGMTGKIGKLQGVSVKAAISRR